MKMKNCDTATTRDINVIDGEIAELKKSISLQQEKLVALYIEGLAALDDPYTEDMHAEWEIVLGIGSDDSPNSIQYVQLEVLDAAYGFAMSESDDELDE